MAQTEVAAVQRDPRATAQAVLLGYLIAFAALTYNVPFGATFLVPLLACFTLKRAALWWRTLVACLALTGFTLAAAWTTYMLATH